MTLLISLLFSVASSAVTPNSYPYQGTIYGTDGQQSQDTVNLIFQIRSDDGSCLLYEEKQSGINLLLSNGIFSVLIGSPVVGPLAVKRTADDQNLSMQQIFSNTPKSLIAVGSENCVAGYTPLPTHTRKLRVIVEGPTGIDTLSPDHEFASTPFATNSNSLQGLLPGDFLQDTNGTMQSEVEALVAGTSPAYVQASGAGFSPSSSFNMNNQLIENIATPVAPTDAVNKFYSDSKVGGINIDPATLGSIQAGDTLVYDSTNNKWVLQPAGGGDSGGATSHSGTSGNISLTSSSPKVHVSKFTDGGQFNLPDATTVSTGGPIFTFFNDADISIPVLDNDGNAIKAVTAGAQADFFLIDDGSTAGTWRAKGSTQSAGIVKKALLSTTGSENIQQLFAARLAADDYVVTYAKDGISLTNFARAMRVNSVTKTVIIGNEVTVCTGCTNYSRNVRSVHLTAGSSILLYRNDADAKIYAVHAGINLSTFDISLGTPLDVGLDWETISQFNGVGIAYDTDTAVLVFETTYENSTAIAIDNSGGTLTVGNSLAVTGDGHGPHQIEQLDADTYIFLRSGDSGPRIGAFDYNGSSFTAGNYLTIAGSSHKGAMKILTPAKIFVISGKTSPTYAINGNTFSIAGNTLILDGTTPILDPIPGAMIADPVGYISDHSGVQKIYYSESMPGPFFSHTLGYSASTDIGPKVPSWINDCGYYGGRTHSESESYCVKPESTNINIHFEVGGP